VKKGRSQTPVAGQAGSEEMGEPSAEHQVYQIRIRGHLDNRWSKWLGGLGMTHENDGTTVLTGPVADQPALHGLLTKIRDLSLPLLSVNVLGPDTAGSSEPQQLSESEPASGRREDSR
jgi:hypothetical protein